MNRPTPFRWATALAVLLGACGTVPPSPTPTATPSPVTVAPTGGTPTVSPPVSTLTLRLWLPPTFAPDPARPGGTVLQSQLEAFEDEHPGLTVEARVKRASGRGGLVDALQTASLAAPGALPDLIALNPDDLARAAEGGLVRPLDDLHAPLTTPEWYDFAVDLSTVDGVFAGVPFAGDATLIAYNANYFDVVPRTWDDVLAAEGTFLFPAGDPAARFTLAQYFSLGGRVQDEAGAVRLDPAILTAVLEFYQRGVDAGALPRTNPYATPTETWRAYRETGAVVATVDAATYLAERHSLNITATGLIPTRDGAPIALVEAWSWALVTADPERQGLALKLLDWLTDPQRYGEWSYAAGVLPARASALSAWPANSAAAVASAVVPVARLLPPAEVLAVVGPPIQAAVQDVLAGRATPQDAAAAAANAVNP